MFLWLHKNGVSPHWEQVLREPWQLQRKCQTADLKQSSNDSQHSALYVLTFLPLYCTLFCWFFHPDEKYLNQWATPVKPLIYWNQFNEATESSSRRDLISSRKEEEAIVLPHWTFSARDGYAQQTQRQESGKNTMQRSRTTDNSMCHSLAGTHLHIKADTLTTVQCTEAHTAITTNMWIWLFSLLSSMATANNAIKFDSSKLLRSTEFTPLWTRSKPRLVMFME